MELVYQFPDLAEIDGLSHISPSELNDCRAEFVFGTTLCTPHFQSQYSSDNKKSATMNSAEKTGMQLLSVMHNWWPSHSYEADKGRPLAFYWKRLKKDIPDNYDFPEATRQTWGYGRQDKLYRMHEKHLQRSGCGFKIGIPPLKVQYYARYFTLLRMPIKLKKVQLRWMKDFNFRHIDTGKLASYWINGWTMEEYNYRKIELPWMKDVCKFSLQQDLSLRRITTKDLAKPKEEVEKANAD